MRIGVLSTRSKRSDAIDDVGVTRSAHVIIAPCGGLETHGRSVMGLLRMLKYVLGTEDETQQPRQTQSSAKNANNAKPARTGQTKIGRAHV